MRDYAVRGQASATVRNRLDGDLRTLDKGSVGKSIDPREGGSYSSLVAQQNPPHAPWQRKIVQWTVRNKIMIRIFLIGMLCGVMVSAAFTYLFAIPANSDYWRWEIWKRCGAAWTFDMISGHSGWNSVDVPLREITPANQSVPSPS